jgi:hypothetical protein
VAVEQRVLIKDSLFADDLVAVRGSNLLKVP